MIDAMKLAAAIVVAICGTSLIAHCAHANVPPTSPAQDARAKQMDEAAKVQAPPTPWECVWVNDKICVSPWLLEKRK